MTEAKRAIIRGLARNGSEIEELGRSGLVIEALARSGLVIEALARSGLVSRVLNGNPPNIGITIPQVNVFDLNMKVL